MTRITAQLPEAFDFLFQPHRYKSARSGRGAAKSWSFARALVIQGAQKKLRILCGRETQKSIDDSVHTLLCDQIQALNIGERYHCGRKGIYGYNGTRFSYAGLARNIQNIKSAESIDRCWIEEAQFTSKHTLETLIPTIRKDGSEIWLSWNPLYETDPVWNLCVVAPPPGMHDVKLTWRDNPWFPEVLRVEKDHLQATDPDGYNHVWEGTPVNTMAGSIYAAEFRAVDREGRIRRVPYEPGRPVDCFWDLGFGDLTAVWMAQAWPMEYRILDYLEGSGHTIDFYIAELQKRGYVFGNDWLPWDIGLHAKNMGSGRSIEELMRLAGRKVRIVPNLSVADQINAARQIFPLCYFDLERTKSGIAALRNFRYDNEPGKAPQKKPIHNWASHASSAFGYLAIGIKQPRTAPPARPPQQPRTAGRSRVWQ